jgi:hypothetical protein
MPVGLRNKEYLGEGAAAHYELGDPGRIMIRHKYVLPEGSQEPYGRSSALHEVQHAIQNREGWEPGTNPDAIFRNKNDIFNYHFDYSNHMATARVARKIIAENPGMPAQHALDEVLKRADHYGYEEHYTPGGPNRQYVIDLIRNQQISDEELKILELENRMQAQKHSITKDQADAIYRRTMGETEARATQKRKDMTMAERRARFPMKDYENLDKGLFTEYQAYDPLTVLKP